MLRIIDVAISLKKYELAIKLSKQALASDPNNASVYNSLALADIHLNNLDEAENFIKLALSYSPNSEFNLMLYAIIMFKKEQYKTSIEKLDEVLKINPQSEPATFFKGSAFAKLKKYKEAEFYLKQALQINPNSNSTYLRLADVYSATNRKELAEQEYLKALKLEPNDSTSLNNYGLFLLDQNWHSKKGLELLRASLKNNPDDKIVIDNYEAYLTFQRFFIICINAYKELFESFCPPEHNVSLIVILLICYFLDYELFIRTCTIMIPLTVLYIIALIYLKYDKFVNHE